MSKEQAGGVSIPSPPARTGGAGRPVSCKAQSPREPTPLPRPHKLLPAGVEVKRTHSHSGEEIARCAGRRRKLTTPASPAAVRAPVSA
ncbi:hypothetical protein DKK73_02220 [Bifidobacterium asteroides]|nr:hypothetical protein DKK73_02220 [Bifidobacterium asteroides]